MYSSSLFYQEGCVFINDPKKAFRTENAEGKQELELENIMHKLNFAVLLPYYRLIAFSHSSL